MGRARGVRYTAEVRGGREVSLAGAVDGGHWTGRLRAHGLMPALADGRARAVVTAVGGSWMGISFREVSLSVAVEPPAGESFPEALFMVAAIHSSRFFALCERTFFHTPYTSGPVQVDVEPCALVLAGRPGTTGLLSARMGPGDRTPQRTDEAGWEGPLLLASGRGRRFYVRVRGRALVYPFEPQRDTVGFAHGGPFDDLSGFTPAEWIVRAKTDHARSRTTTHAV